MADSYPYDRPFRCKILALMLDNRWMAKYGNTLIQPEYFERTDEEQFAKVVLDYRQSYGCSPKDTADILAMGKLEPEFVDEIFDLTSLDLRLAGDIVIKFAKEQAAKLAVLESVDDIQRGDLDKLVPRIKDALKVGDSLLSLGIDPIADVDKWLYDYWGNKVPTGFTHIDIVLEGGVGSSELGCILAPQNRGKSMTLINLGHAAASIMAGKNVAHFTHEMKAEQVAKRYAARLTFRFPNKAENLNDYADMLIEQARKLMPGRIRVLGGAYRMTYADIESSLDRLIDEGFEPGLIIDDYGDLIIPARRYTDKRFEISENFEFLRQLSGDYDCPVWTASQATRASHSKEIITMADIAEDIGKVSISDIVISLNQTWEEQQVNQCRLFMAKVRDGQSRGCFQAKYFGASQAIITTGIAEKKEEKEV